MKFSQEWWRDLQKYYQGTFVKFPNIKKHMDTEETSLDPDTIFYIRRVDPSRILGTYLNKEGVEEPFEFLLWSEEVHGDSSAPEVEFIFPQKTVYNADDGNVYFLSRIPAKQYRKGIAPENTQIIRLGNNEWSEHKTTINFPSLQQYCKKQEYYPYLPEQMLGKQPLALSNRFSIAKAGNIFVDTRRIGRLLKTKNYYEIILGSPLFFKEVSKLFQHLSIPIRISDEESKKIASEKSEKSKTKSKYTLNLATNLANISIPPDWETGVAGAGVTVPAENPNPLDEFLSTGPST